MSLSVLICLTLTFKIRQTCFISLHRLLDTSCKQLFLYLKYFLKYFSNVVIV